jgi:hypothetical protein
MTTVLVDAFLRPPTYAPGFVARMNALTTCPPDAA